MPGYTPRRRHKRGALAERKAESYLIAQGLQLEGRNYNCRFGEIDLIMRDKQHLVFVEVRFRSSNRFGGALASIEKHKQARLIRTAQHYLAFEVRESNVACRFDVVAVSASHFTITWIKNAFSQLD